MRGRALRTCASASLPLLTSVRTCLVSLAEACVVVGLKLNIALTMMVVPALG